MCRAPEGRGAELSDQFERIVDDVFAIDYVRDEGSLAGAFDSDGGHLLVTLAVAGQAAGHDLEALREAKLQEVEVFVVDKLDFLLAVAAVTFFEFSSFGHNVFLLKWYFVFVDVDLGDAGGRGVLLFRCRRCGGLSVCRGSRGGVVVATLLLLLGGGTIIVATTVTSATGVVIPTSQHLHLLDGHGVLGAFGAVLSCPLLEYETSFDEDFAPLVQVLIGDLSGASEEGDVDKHHFLFLLTGLIFPFAVGGQTGVADGSTALGVAHFDITGQVADQNHFVVHGELL